MNFNEVKELISILDDSKLAYFELENELKREEIRSWFE